VATDTIIVKEYGGTMILKKLIAMIVISSAIFASTACDSKGPVEKVGEKIDQTMEKASDKAKEVGEAVKETTQ
jgi:hypothetical protein